MENPREKVRSKVLIISISVILFFVSNGKLNKSSDWLGGLFYIEVTDFFVIGLITIYFYYSIRYFVLRNDNELKYIFTKVLELRQNNRLYLYLIGYWVSKEIDKLTPIKSTLNGDYKSYFSGQNMEIDSGDCIKITNRYSLRNVDKFTFSVQFINQTKNQKGIFYIKLNKFLHYLFVLLSIPKYFFDDYFYDVVLPYITLIISWIIIIIYLLGFQDLIVQDLPNL